MIKNKFYKNLYQSISCFSVIIILVVSLLAGFIASLNHSSNNGGWVLLMIAISLLILYFFIGFYWIFQKIEIDYDGIKVTFFSKVIRKIEWDNIEEIVYSNVMRNPAYVIFTKNSKKLNLDSRKQIKSAIKYFGDENAKLQVEKLIK